MEASGAGLAAAPGGDAAQAQQANGQQAANGQAAEAQQQDGTDLGAISGQLNDLGQLLESQREYLQSEPWAQQPVEPEADPTAGLDFLAQPDLTPDAAATQLMEFVQAQADARVKEAVGPLQEKQQEMQRQVETDQLIGRYPELGSNDAIAQEVIARSKQFAEAIGHPELQHDPRVWEREYLASRAERQAGQEGSGSASAATLEGAGGASPGGAGQGDALITQSVTQGWGTSRLPLFGGQAR